MSTEQNQMEMIPHGRQSRWKDKVCFRILDWSFSLQREPTFKGYEDIDAAAAPCG